MTQVNVNDTPWNSAERLSAVLAKWAGPHINDAQSLCRVIDIEEHGRWIQRHIMEEMIGAGEYGGYETGVVLSQIVALLSFGMPAKIEDPRGKIRFFQSYADRSRDKYTVATQGKAFRKVIPAAPDSVIERLVDAWRRNYEPAANKYTLCEGDTADDFIAAYASTTAPARNMSIAGIKSLTNSCMRPESKAGYSDSSTREMFTSDNHPARAYASGDFRVYWAHDAERRTAARVVVRVDNGPAYCPIYAVDDQSAQMLLDKMAEIGAKECRTLEGARLRYVTYENNVSGPFLDVCPARGYRDGRHIVLSEDGAEYDFCTTNGYPEGVDSEPDYICEHCGEGCDEISTVWTLSRRGIHISQGWCEYCTDHASHVCESGDNWAEEHVTHAGNGECLSPDDIESGDWEYCEHYNDWFPTSDMVDIEKANGESVRISICALQRDSDYAKDAFGDWQYLDDMAPCNDGPHKGKWIRADSCEEHGYSSHWDGLRWNDPAQLTLTLEQVAAHV